MKEVNGFLITNSYVSPFDVPTEGDTLLVKYDVVLKNLEKRKREIDLSHALVTSEKKSFPLGCQSYENKQVTFAAEANEIFRITCEAKVSKSVANSGDTKLLIGISLAGENAVFEYVIRAEDVK